MTSTLLLAILGCGGDTPEKPDAPTVGSVGAAAPDAERAVAFAAEVDAELRRLWTISETAEWELATNITDENEAKASAAQEATMAYLSRVIPEAKAFANVDAPADVKRQLHLLQLAAGLPAPNDPEKRARLAEVSTKLASMYGKGAWCPPGVSAPNDACLGLGALEAQIGDVKAPAADRQLAWERWREVSKPMKPLYAEFVALGNEGAKEIGFDDMGALWRSTYDMEPDALEREVDRLYAQVAPLYEQLHCHVRATLNAQHGDAVSPTGPIPAHLTGNMWAQDWDLLYSTMVPFPNEPSLDVTAKLASENWDPIRMTRAAESFFVSMGLDPLPQTFWERSMFVDPPDREVECHASAWDVGMQDDLRIKMCIKPTQEDLYTLHHELGHNYYFHYYYTLPVLFQNGAHDGFHEAIGDAVMLSVTPGYLKQIGLLDEASDTPQAVVNKQLQSALGKVAFLPFGRMIDQWRWDVFSGEVGPDEYNAHWWRLRERFQGVAAPGPRPDDAFDPGAKYHIPGNTPYMRYFLAHVLQYQLYEAMCDASGHTGPLHECSFFGSKEAGDRLKGMLALGASKPWPDALEAATGKREMDASALIRYYEPLGRWLAEQNQGRACGW